ncbi:hypothetical protein HF325_002565 [Metschnikowia pulcherrima]|uniref:Uncharacterized protein n=1 Tax=Metschnikowia pulcherrima TaxID=27326 RepID=A0A8H7GT89_9ASCO|nr:hypothetical protein HF325_002565 [Metschnikowia pulcherrima]
MLGLAHGYVATCIINISTNDDKVYLGVSVENGNDPGSQKANVFDFDTAGTMKVTGKNEYLGLDNSGKLVVTSKAQGKFERKARSGFALNALVFNGMREYQLCGDYTIGLNSTCAGARKATISIEDVPVFG